MYRVSKTVVKQTEHPELFSLFTKYGVLATNLYNAGLFRVRQNFTMQGKEVLHPLEQEVKLEIERTVTEKNLGRPRRSMSYLFLEKLMRVTWNPDFFAGLSMQCAQNVLKQVCGDFVNYFLFLNYSVVPVLYLSDWMKRNPAWLNHLLWKNY